MRKILFIPTIILMMLSCEKNDMPTTDPGDDSQKPETGFPEEARFKIVQDEFYTYMDLQASTPAPFERVAYKVLDNNDVYNAMSYPAFTDYYDSIIVSIPGMPDKYPIFKTEHDEGYFEIKFTSRFCTYYFEDNDFKMIASGYKDGEIIYEYSLEQTIRERDFLCIDWRHKTASPEDEWLSNYSIFDTGHSFSLSNIKESDGNLYAILKNVASIFDEEETLAGLRWILDKSMGAPTGQDASAFKTLPEEDEPVEVYENSTTRAVIVRHEREYDTWHYAIIEPKQEITGNKVN